MTTYFDVHHHRTNLLVHALTVPVFLVGTLAIPLAIVAGPWWLALAGAVAMIAAIGAQGATHRLEDRAPDPFRGPVDVIARLFEEQWITFPRYVATGGFARAWRGSSLSSAR
jgi:hypothetical protein